MKDALSDPSDSIRPTLEERSPRILVAALNWGLGHASRCIPIIRALEEMGAFVVLAADGVALGLLKAEFPHLPVIELPSYRIRYDTHNMVYNIARQMPRLLYAVRSEQWATERIVRSLGIQGIISDNRYGCFSRRTHNVMITHQLHLRIPGRFLSWFANALLRKALARFQVVWAPDYAGAPNLSGQLSHGAPAHKAVSYIGPLSRMRNYTRDLEYDVAVVLSGPEPQRSILEQRLLEQALSLPYKFIFIQGKTRVKEHYFVSDNVEVVSYLTSRELNDVLLASEVLVGRSGYSSIMDLAALGKKALLIPTPGQTEQEYLARHIAQNNAFLVQQQDKIDLEKALKEIHPTSGFAPGMFEAGMFIPVLQHWLDMLQGRKKA